VQNELTFHQFVDGISSLVAVLTPDGAVDFCNRQVLDKEEGDDATLW
jgi:hypothetical protein